MDSYSQFSRARAVVNCFQLARIPGCSSRARFIFYDPDRRQRKFRFLGLAKAQGD